jgi:hypothetical protein
MKIVVTLEDDEVVEDWIVFRDVMEQAAEQLDLKVTEIVHARER